MSWGLWGLTDTPEVSWRLAMAWDEWEPKITHNAPEYDGTPFGNQGSYVINHGSGQDESGLVYSLNAEGPEDNSIFIDSLYSHPKFRNQGIAEAFFRRLNQDYPDRKINPGAMTGMGQEFHDRMLDKEPSAKDLVTAANRILQAMAWEDYAPNIESLCENCKFKGPRWRKNCQASHGDPEWDANGGSPMIYGIKHDNGGFSRLDYAHYLDKKGKPYLGVEMLRTALGNRDDGVAEALMRRLSGDYPGIPINPGSMTEMGQGFHDRMLEKEPMARDLVRSAHRLLQAMAWDEWSDKIEHRRMNPILPPDEEHNYFIDHDPTFDGERESVLSFTVQPDKKIFVQNLYTEKPFRNKGIAESFFRRLHQDYPEHRIEPGSMSQEGQAFHDRMLEKEPTARDLVAARLAMAWEDYKDKIVRRPEDEDDLGNVSGRYVIPQAGAFLNYTHGTHMGQPAVKVEGIYTHPDNRGDGVAEALMRRLSEDHPGIPINPGYMTPDGQKFHDRMLDKEPSAKELVTAALRTIQAMAWDEWAPQIQHFPKENTYSINHPHSPDRPDRRYSDLTYVLDDEDKRAHVGMLFVDEDFRNKGIGEALMRRLHEDHPDYKIVPGSMTDRGRAFHDKMLEKEPRAKDLVTAALRRASEATGDCYEAAARYLMDNAIGMGVKEPNNNLRVVHGEVAMQGPHTGKTMGHAWIEDGDNVIDQSNGRDFRMPKNVYYQLGKINELNNFHSYTPEEARGRLIDLQHYGPWDLSVNGEPPPGRVELDDEDEDDYEDDYEDDDDDNYYDDSDDVAAWLGRN
jgi:GNAT superfamily N-acetyltransferase